MFINKNFSDQQSLFIKERTRNIITLFLNVFLLIIAILFMVLTIQYQWGYLFLILPIFLLIFAFFKSLRSILLLINLSKRHKTFNIKRLNIYIYESWHKKIIGNFWIYLLFDFLLIYSLTIYLIASLSINNLESLWVGLTFWWELIFVGVAFILSTLIYWLNHWSLMKIIYSEQKYIKILEINLKEIRLLNETISEDYRNFTIFVISFLTILPIFYIVFRKVQKNFKK